jgi:protocatechuate 3,4-dioxygenase beta subunit
VNNNIFLIILIIIIGLVTITSFTITFYSTTAFAQSTNQTSTTLQPSPQQQQQDSFCKLTESDMLGPFYKEGAPFKQTLNEGVKEGERLIITGKVTDTRCQPIKNAVLDIWQANSTGKYDNEGFTLRGKINTDNDGNYVIDTIVPKEYAAGDINRPGHIHLKVGAPNQPILTTQLYFEGDPYLTDREDKSLIMKVTDDKNGTKKANFDFVIEYYDEYEK